jgi:GNAT superfamily N-acetyltransferase
MLSVVHCTVAGIRAAGTFPQLAAEYERNSPIDGMPTPSPDWDHYEKLEAAGRLFAFGAAIDGALVGFLGLLVAKVPRYAEPIATIESFFVSASHRKGGAALKLLRAAEEKAQELGAPGLLASALPGSPLFEILPRLGYAEAGRTFFKKAAVHA